jgi:hypothetical protein
MPSPERNAALTLCFPYTLDGELTRQQMPKTRLFDAAKYLDSPEMVSAYLAEALTIDQYESALKEIETYFNDVPIMGTEAAARFELLLALIKHFEDQNFPIADGDRDEQTP